MPLRLVEITVSSAPDAAERLAQTLEEATTVDSWEIDAGDRLVHRILLEARHVEELADRLTERFSADERFRVVAQAVEATLPMPSEEPETDPDPAPDRVAREELRSDLVEASRPSALFFVQVVLSTLVAAVGLVTDSTAVLIGAMVIAPLLGPNVALAFGATLGDLRFIQRALVANVAGVSVAFVLSAAMGAALGVDPSIPSIAGRTEATVADIVLALASGVAGTLAMTSGVAAPLIGVMVAVALLPPVSVAGLLLGGGHAGAATGALLLLSVNVICINLASVATFVAVGIRPRGWWEQEGARRSSRLALLVWAALLTLLLLFLLWPAC